MITLENVTKSFEDVKALKGINLQVKKGSIFGIVGTNGAGKTTLLKSVAGVYKIDTGKITVDGQDVYENQNIKSKIFFIPDNPYFFGNFTIDDMAKFYKNIFPSWSNQRFMRLKDIFNLNVKKRLNRLSKGMQKQAAIWLGLSTMPEILILDEPFDGLDPIIRKTFKNALIDDVAERNITVLISSHNLKELEDLCDTMAILHDGNVLLQKDLDEIKQNIFKFQAVFKKDFNINSADGFQILSHSKKGNVDIIIAKGNQKEIVDILKNFDPIILDILPLTLDEIFIYEMEGIGYEIKSIIF